MKTRVRQARAYCSALWRERYRQFEMSWSRASRCKKIGMFAAVYTALFLVTFLLAYSPFLMEGKTLVWHVDGRAQHYPTLAYTGRYLRQIILSFLHGNFSVPMFDLNIGLGSDVISTLNYYGFGDPLHLLSVFVPTIYIECLYCFLVIFRMYLSGLAFSALCAFHQKRVSHTLVGALIYVFSGYTIFSAVRHPYFINPMIQLPLLLIGTDKIICRKKPLLFILTVFYSALCGFYFLYMMTIMLGIYALIRFFDHYPTKQIKEFAQMVWRMIWAYLIGIGMASIFFIPSVVSFLTSDRFGVTVKRNYSPYSWTTYRETLLKIIAPPASTSYSILALAAITLLAVVLLFSVRKRRRSLKLLCAAGACIFLLPLGGYIMNGFGYLSNRWTFGLALLLSYVVVEMMPTLLNLDHKQKWICFAALFVYMLCIFAGSENRSTYYLVGVAMLGATLVVLLLVNDHSFRKPQMKHLGAAACILLMIGNVSVNAIYAFAADQANYIGEFSAYGAETERLASALVREAEPYSAEQAGRFDSESTPRNTGAVWHVPTLSSYWSIINSHVSEYWLKTENIEQWYTNDFHGTDRRSITNTLLGVKYLINSTSNVPYGYTFLEETENGNVIYENQYALPWGYTYDSYISYDAMEQFNGLELEDAMLQTIALDEDVNGVPAASVESSSVAVPYEVTEMNGLEWENGVLNVKEENATMTLEFQMPEQTEGYLRLQGFCINEFSQKKRFNVTVECDKIRKYARAMSTSYSWYYGREDYLYNLGYSEEMHTSCAITFPAEGTFRLDEIQLYALPMDKYPEQVEARRAEPLENIEFETNQITGTVDLSQNKILCMSIPYSSGWTAKIDGEKVEILRGNYMFMALPLEEGHHEIEFTYCTPGLKAGVVCCVISVGALLYYAFREKKRRNSR